MSELRRMLTYTNATPAQREKWAARLKTVYEEWVAIEGNATPDPPTVGTTPADIERQATESQSHYIYYRHGDSLDRRPRHVPKPSNAVGIWVVAIMILLLLLNFCRG